MGPDETTGLIELNGEGSLSGTEYYLKNHPSQVLE